MEEDEAYRPLTAEQRANNELYKKLMKEEAPTSPENDEKKNMIIKLNKRVAIVQKERDGIVEMLVKRITDL